MKRILFRKNCVHSVNSVQIFCASLLLAAGSAQAQLKVTTEFEGGSAQVLALDADKQEIRISPAGKLERGMPNWWYLRVDGIDTTKPLSLEVVALDVSTPAEGNSEGKTNPLNPGWTLPTCAAISTNGSDWRQTDPTRREGNRAVYRVNPASRTLWLAWGPPFTPRDAAAWIATMTREHSFAKQFSLGKSREGREVLGLEIREGTKADRDRPAVFIIGRQHAWEVGGSWVGVGMAEWIAGSDAPAQWVRQNAQVFVVPLLDVDHVATGDGGKHARPQDHNRDWSEHPHWPEVAAAQKRIQEIANRLAVFLDLHNPSPGATAEMFYVQYPPYVSDSAGALQERFLSFAREQFSGLRLTDGKPSKPEHLPIWKCISTPWAYEHGNSNTISFTIETPWNTPEGTAGGYREVGRKLAVTVERYLRERVK